VNSINRRGLELGTVLGVWRRVKGDQDENLGNARRPFSPNAVRERCREFRGNTRAETLSKKAETGQWVSGEPQLAEKTGIGQNGGGAKKTGEMGADEGSHEGALELKTVASSPSGACRNGGMVTGAGTRSQAPADEGKLGANGRRRKSSRRLKKKGWVQLGG